MSVLRIQGFSGVVPVTGDRALPDSFATASVNTWLYGSELRGIRPPEELQILQPSTRRVLRIPKRTLGGDPEHPAEIPPPSYLGDSVWVQFQDHDVDIVKGQLVNDQYERYYFCSPSLGPRFNTYLNMSTGLVPDGYKLGVPPPPATVAFQPVIPVGGIVGGAAPVLTRSFAYTWVNIFGEESAPALPVTGAGNASGQWTITNILDPPMSGTPPVYTPFIGFAPYQKKRLYRTITGASGQTTFYRIAELLPNVTSYVDDGAVMTDAILAGELIMESVSWQPPPGDLQGFIAMPNGFLIGFKGNTVYMSESYHFHAWPEEYQYASETPIVGLGVLGQTCVVCTQGYPATITGSKPATCSFTKATTGEPCLSRGSIVSGPQGVIYASQNGLTLVGPGGITNVTQQIITRDDWLRKYSPAYLRACRYQDGYLAIRHPPDPHPHSGFYLDPTELKVALTELSDFEDVHNLNVDFWSGEVFMISADGVLRLWDPPTEQIMPTQWRSKEFQYAFQENFGAYAIYWDENRYTPPTDPDYNPWGEGLLPVGQRVRFLVYADRRKVYDEVVPKNGRPVRLPSGFKADIWQFEIKSRVPVYTLHVASTVKELKAV